jgi:hypothetical protein
VDLLLTVVTGLVSSFILGTTKKLTGAADKVAFQAVKPFQPIIVAALSVALPLAANALGITNIPDAAVFASAPASSLLAIAARELALKLTPKSAP